MPDNIARAFRAAIAPILEEDAIPHEWSASSDFVHLAILQVGDGFTVHANVSAWHATVILDRICDRAWDTQKRRAVPIDEVSDWLFSVLSPVTRLRIIRRGRRVNRWVLERDYGGQWFAVASRRSFNPLSYFGPQSETVRQNSFLRVRSNEELKPTASPSSLIE